MSYTMDDFIRELVKKEFDELSPREQVEVLRTLPREVFQPLRPAVLREFLELLTLEERLAGLSPEQIRQYLDQLTAGRPAAPRKPRRKK